MNTYLLAVVLATSFSFADVAGNSQVTPVVSITVIAPQPDPNMPVLDNNHMYAHKDQPIILACTIDNKPPDTFVHWNFYPKDSSTVIPISFNLQSYDDSKWKVEAGVAKGNTYRLSLLSPGVKSEGRYECSAEYDDFAPPVKEGKYIEIISKPIISASRSSTDISAKPGDNVELQCQAEGLPTPGVTWRRAGKAFLPTGGEFHTQPSMTIKNIQPEHQGEYICEAKNKAGQDTLKIVIKLNFPPKITAEKEVYQKVGYKKDLICMIDASPIPKENQVVWSKSGRVITTGGRFKIGYTYGLNSVESYLSILGVQPDDFGAYTCVATADGNSKSATITLAESETPTADKRGLMIGASSPLTISLATIVLCLTALLIHGR
ncbi:protein amalgam-like isoform X2 [Lineus longissimus]|uniref:protein amalgam-like isoform X2 n=1 Tax=Lineus longissimus TaxID=88925 RepID=UPI002B4E9C96